TAVAYLPWTALYVLLSVAAFQLDGVFIGATRTREMRNAGLVSVAVFLLCAWPLAALFGNHGLWAAFVVFVVARALALLPYWRRLQAGALPAWAARQRQSAFAKHVALRVHHQPQAPVVVVVGHAPATGILAGAAFAQHGDLAVVHQLA